MTYYVPSVPTAEGMGLLKVGIRDYLARDLSSEGLPSVVELLPAGNAGLIDEGNLGETPVPLVMITSLGDGETELDSDVTLVRFIIYAVNRGVGLFEIERILSRMRTRLNRSDLVHSFLTFNPASGLRLDSLEVSGSTASKTSKAWKAETRGLYLFARVRGLQATF